MWLHTSQVRNTGDGYKQEENTYLIICPFVFCDSPNRSDRVFHCFWHCHGEDGWAGQVDGGILQHFEWNCNEVSDHDHVVSGSVLTSLWWGVRWSWGLHRTLNPPSRKEWAGMNQGKISLERLWKKGMELSFLELSIDNEQENYKACGPDLICHLFCVACELRMGSMFLFCWKKKSRILIITTRGYSKFIFSAHK